MASKHKSSSQLQAEKAYNRERRRIQEFVRRSEKRGYRYAENPVPKPISQLKRRGAKTVSAKRLHRLTEQLKEISPSKLLEESSALSSITGKVISGTERRKEERSEASRKSAITRKKKRTVGIEKPSGIDVITDDEWEKIQRKKDEENRKKLEQDRRYRELFAKANVVYNSIQSMILDVSRNFKRGAEALSSALSEEMSRYGSKNVMHSIAIMGEANQGELLKSAEIAIRYSPGDYRHDGAIRAIQELILGSLPTREQAIGLDSAIEADAYTNDSH